MLTKQTYLFNMILFIAAIFILGIKMKNSSKKHQRKRSSTTILIIHEGKTRDFPSLLKSFLERHATVELRELKNFQVADLGAELQIFNKIIFLCKIGERMELHQEKIVKDLDQKRQNDLKVFYLLNQGSGSYHVTKTQDQEVNAFVDEIDEKFLEENLKDFVNVTNFEKNMKRGQLILFLLGLLCFGSIYGCLQSSGEDSSIFKVRIVELEEEFSKISQSYDSLQKDYSKLTEDFIQMEDILHEKELDYLARSKELIAKEDEIQNFITLISERDQSLKQLGDQIVSLKQSLAFAQNQAQETRRSNEELQNNYRELEGRLEKTQVLLEQEEKKNKELEECKEKLEESQRKLIASGNEKDQKLSQAQKDLEEIRRNLKKDIGDNMKYLPGKQESGNLACRVVLGVGKLVC